MKHLLLFIKLSLYLVYLRLLKVLLKTLKHIKGEISFFFEIGWLRCLDIKWFTLIALGILTNNEGLVQAQNREAKAYTTAQMKLLNGELERFVQQQGDEEDKQLADQGRYQKLMQKHGFDQ